VPLAIAGAVHDLVGAPGGRPERRDRGIRVHGVGCERNARTVQRRRALGVGQRDTERHTRGTREEAVFDVVRGDRIRIRIRVRRSCDQATGQQPAADLQQLDFRLHGDFLGVTGGCNMNKDWISRADSLALVTEQQQYYDITLQGLRELP